MPQRYKIICYPPNFEIVIRVEDGKLSILGVNSWQNKVYTFTAGVGQRVCIDTVGWLHGGFIFISNDAGYLVNCAYTVIAYNASATFHQTTIVNWNTGTVGAPTLSESGGNVILNTTGNAYCIYTLI